MASKSTGFSNPFTDKNNPFKDKKKVFNPFAGKPSNFPTDIFNGALKNKDNLKKIRDYAVANKIIEEQPNAFGERAEWVRKPSDKGFIWVRNPKPPKPPGQPKPRPDQTITVHSVKPLPAWTSTPWQGEKPVGIFGYGPEQWKFLEPNQRVFAYIHHMIRFDKKSQAFSNSPLESPEVQSFITAVSLYITLTSAGQAERASVVMNGLYDFVVTITPKMLSAVWDIFDFLRAITHSNSPTVILEHPEFSNFKMIMRFNNFMDGLFGYDVSKRQQY